MYLTADFGPNNGGIATTGYTLKNAAGGDAQARTTTGVVDQGNGMYGVEIDLPPDFPDKYRKPLIRAADQCAVKRMLEDPAPSGTAEGKVNELDKMLPEYYEVRGWTTEGVPSNETLQRLSL